MIVWKNKIKSDGSGPEFNLSISFTNNKKDDNVDSHPDRKFLCSKRAVANCTSTLSMSVFPTGSSPSMKPIWPPFLVVTRIRLGLDMAASLGIAGGEDIYTVGCHRKMDHIMVLCSVLEGLYRYKAIVQCPV